MGRILSPDKAARSWQKEGGMRQNLYQTHQDRRRQIRKGFSNECRREMVDPLLEAPKDLSLMRTRTRNTISSTGRHQARTVQRYPVL